MNKTIHTAMILAAGMGSRLRPLTDDTPKPLINVGGKPVILRALEAIRKAGIQRVVINTHYLPHLVERTVAANTMGVHVIFSREENLLETGGGIKKALPLLGDAPFLVVNSDAVWNEDENPLLRNLMSAFSTKKHDALLAVVPVARTKDFRPEGPDFMLDKKTKHLAFIANKMKHKPSKNDVVYAGVHVTHPAFVAHESAYAFSLVKPWRMAASVGRLHGFNYDAPWADMGTHTGLHYAREMVRTT